MGTIRLSQRKIANLGAAYTAQFLGLPVRHRTDSGEEIAAVVESFRNPVSGATGYPILRLADGRWARGDLALLRA